MRKHEEAFATSAKKRDITIARSRPGLSTITKAEVSVSDIGRFMRGRSFASLDEANAFIKKPARPGVLHHYKHLARPQGMGRNPSAGPHCVSNPTEPAPDPSFSNHDLVGFRRQVA